MKLMNFTLRDIVLMSMLGGLVFALRFALRIPMHLTGKSGVFWVIPIIVGVGIIGKFGTGSYIGVISGILAVVMGMGDTALDAFNYVVIGVSIDVLCLVFRGYLDNVFVGIIVGAGGHLCKLISKSYIDMLTGTSLTIILLGIAYAAILHAIFGGIGGGLSALILDRLYRSGVVKRHERR